MPLHRSDPHGHLLQANLLDIARFKLVGRPARQHPVHDWHELIYVVRGRYRVEVGGRCHEAGPGSSVHHPAGTVHSPRSEAGSGYASYVLSWRGPAIALPAPGPTPDPGGCLLSCLELLHRAVAERPISTTRCQALLVAALAEAECLTAGPAEDRLLAARRYIHQHLARATLGVAEVAALVGLSRVHFTTRFTARFGESPGAYRQRSRLEAAIRLLVAGDRSVGEIASTVGYRDGATLARALRTAYGRSPSSFRT